MPPSGLVRGVEWIAHHAEVGLLWLASWDLVITGRVEASFLTLLWVTSLVLVGGLHILLIGVQSVQRGVEPTSCYGGGP